MSSDEELVPIRKKKYLVDSDEETETSKEELHVHNKNFDNEENTQQHVIRKKKKETRRLRTLNSSSESDTEESLQKTVDLESLDTTIQINTSKNSLSISKNDQDDSFEKNVPSSTIKSEQKSKSSWYKNNDLFEDESSEEEVVQTQDIRKSDGEEQELESDNNSISPLPQRKERESKTKAHNEIQEIHKESQRMMREARVSIPYHRPRQRTLAEFRNRRKATPTISLHTSADQLVTAWKAIEQREKEAEMFYKSESSEEETENDMFKEQTNKFVVQEKSDQPRSNLDAHDSSISKDNNISSSQGESNSKIINGEEKEISDLTNCDNHNDELLSKQMGNDNSCIDGHNEPNIDENSLIKHQDIKENVVNNREQQDQIDKENKTDQVNSIKLCEGEQTSCSEDKNSSDSVGYTEIAENISQPEQGQIILNNVERIELNSDKLSSSSMSNLANTEEFSLRLSESQSDKESFSKLCEMSLSCSTTETKDRDDAVQKSSEIKENSFFEDVSVGKEIYKTKCQIDLSEMINNKLDSHLVEDHLNVCDNENRHSSGIDCEESTILNQPPFEQQDINRNDNLTQNNDENCSFNTIPMDNRKLEEINIENKLNMKYNYDSYKTVSHVPKISGSHDEVIDLAEEVVKPGVSRLMERFYTHLSYKKKPAKKKTPLDISIVSAETDTSGHVSAINEEVVKILVGDEEEEEDPALSKPGAKFARLKAHLQAEMGKQREVEWTKKQQDQRLYEEEIYDGEKEVCDGVNEDVDEAEDESKESSEEESTEDEENELEEEDDELTEEKNEKKSLFIDDEAEESDEEQCFQKDESSDSFIKRPKQKKVILKRSATEDMFLSQEVLKSSHNDEEELTSFQKPLTLGEKAEEREEVESLTSSVCPSPVFRLTGLEGKDVNAYNFSEPTTPCKEFISPKFISPKTVTPVRTKLAHLVDRSPLLGSEDLENLCSGQFSSQPIQDVEEQTTQDFQLFLAEDSQESQATPEKRSLFTQNKSPDKKDQIKALLIDDDDDLASNVVNKKVKKLDFSDDEDEHSDDTQQVEENSGESDLEEEKLDDENEVPTEDVAYDSEENEVIKTAGDFLDKEAELSESEWGSEDEDEHGLDALEMEEADKEKIDQRKLRQQLDQIQRKQMLIEDKKEVRLLQEMLLEDGELHSENRRQRLFRWSNNAFGEEDNKALIDSDEEKAEDEEDEENWRRSRHEREQFLNEHSKKAEKLELGVEEQSDSQLLRLGQKALKRINSQEPKLSSPVDPLASPDPKQPYNLFMKRGSFLSRGQQVLSRLAQMVASTSDAPIKQPTNSRNFVFTSISPTKNSEEEVKPPQPSNKRKMPVLPLPVPKKPCMQKTKTANKKSLFEMLSKVQS